MNETDENPLNLPTANDVRNWRAQRDALAAKEAEEKEQHLAKMKELKTQRTQLDRLISAAAPFLEGEAEKQPELAQRKEAATEAPRVRVRRRNRTWTATILRILQKEGRGMTHQELKDAVGQTHLGPTLERTEKSFYGAIGRLAEAGKIVKHKGRLYSPKTHQQFMADVAAGKAIDEPAPSARGGHSPNYTAVISFLKDRPEGATGSEIVNNLIEHPPAHLDISKNRNSLYNVLAKLRKDGELIKRGDRYRLPRSKRETPGSSEPSESHSHGDGDGNPSSSGTRGNGHSPSAFRVPSRHTPGV